jgi:diguanylate cyclase (GGDEF)-like protein/PAS domain S-box-containing protein
LKTNEVDAMMRIGPIARVSLGLVSIITFLLLALDLFFGLLSDDVATAKKIRKRVSETVAVQLATSLQSNDREALAALMRAMVARDEEILSIGLRKHDGELIAQTAQHTRNWVAQTGDESTLTHVVVPINTDKRRWGSVEVAFRPIAPHSVQEWLAGPSMVLIGAVFAVGFVLFYLYMRRVLQHLDPTKVIPERVRTAFDTLTEGVLVLDDRGRIVLANSAFRGLHGDARANLQGRRASDLPWLRAGLGANPRSDPWSRVMQSQQPINGEMFEIPVDQERSQKVAVNCSPIADGHGKVRGALATFDDVTALDQANAQLRDAMAELRASQEKIEKQNIKLEHLANRDPLTECLNRRAFFASFEQLCRKAEAQGQELFCIMTDIDHFKSFNDRFGHSVGDKVIRIVADLLRQGLRDEDLLCRYGGEEFCIVVPGAGLERVLNIAERLRASIEQNGDPALGEALGARITSSFGVASSGRGTVDPMQLIDRADAALYAAKKAGRNRVVLSEVERHAERDVRQLETAH